MYLRYSQTLVTFAEAFANGFVLEKRTHLGGVLTDRMQGGMAKDRRSQTAATGGGAKERVLKTCVSAKRTHRFLVKKLL